MQIEKSLWSFDTSDRLPKIFSKRLLLQLFNFTLVLLNTS